MYKILEKQVLSDVTKLVVVAAPHVARKAKAGQFVIVIATEHGERIPLTIADSDAAAGTITLIFQEVGKSTMEMGQFEVGDGFYSVAGPLGHPTEIENFGTVVCVAGGVGISPMYPIARVLKAAGNHVISIIGARTKELLFWEEKMAAVSDELFVCTDDGTYGRKALVTQPLKELLEAGAHTRCVIAAGGVDVAVRGETSIYVDGYALHAKGTDPAGHETRGHLGFLSRGHARLDAHERLELGV